MKNLLLALALIFAAAPAATACPLCKESIPEGVEGQTEFDPERQSSGYNYSIYFMLTVPFTLVGVMGFFIYRQCRKVDGAHPAE